MATMTGRQALLRSLLAHGVDTLFGAIATHTIHLYDALHDLQPARRHVGGRLELGLGYMAGGYARASGRPGVLVTSARPGAADAVGALGKEYHPCTPLLLTATAVGHDLLGLGRGARHEARDQTGVLRAVSDRTALVPSVEAVPDAVAFRRLQGLRRVLPAAAWPGLGRG